MKVIYQPPTEDEPPLGQHACDLPAAHMATVNTAVECEECGLRWVCRERLDPDDRNGMSRIHNWVRLRPVHRPWWVLRWGRRTGQVGAHNVLDVADDDRLN